MNFYLLSIFKIWHNLGGEGNSLRYYRHHRHPRSLVNSESQLQAESTLSAELPEVGPSSSALLSPSQFLGQPVVNAEDSDAETDAFSSIDPHEANISWVVRNISTYPNSVRLTIAQARNAAINDL